MFVLARTADYNSRMNAHQLATLLAGLLYISVSDGRPQEDNSTTSTTGPYNLCSTVRPVNNVEITCTDYKSSPQTAARKPSPLLAGGRNPKLDITIRCWDNSPLQIDFSDLQGLDPDVAGVQLHYCNLTETDFTFLAALPSAFRIFFHYCSRTTFRNFPYLPNMQSVGLYSTLLEEWPIRDKTPNVTSFALSDLPPTNTLSLLDSLAYYEDLTDLTFSYNQLGYIPVQVKQFTKLESFMFINPMIRLTRGSLDFNVPVESIDIFQCGLEHIEEGALAGNFSNAFVGLSRNNLTLIEEAVFKPILTSMYQMGKFGVVDLAFNPLVCGCDVRWLVQDNRHLLEHISAQCGGVRLELVDPADLNYCSELTTVASTTASAGKRLAPYLLPLLMTAKAAVQLLFYSF